MKRKLRSNFCIALAAAFLLCLTANRVSADDFDLNVPFRGGDGAMQTARIRITLTMAIAPLVGTDQLLSLDAPAGSQVGGPRTMTDSAVGGGVNAVTGFRVSFFSLPAAPNEVVIDITFLSKFVTVGNFCRSTDPDGFNVALRYVPQPGNSILSYRFSSYSAPSNNTNEQCQCPSRRLNLNAPTFGTPPPGTDRGRNGYDVVLVLDRSGSMGEVIPLGLDGSTGTEVKMAVMKEAVKEFIDTWRDEPDAPLTDRLAIVGFDSSVTVLPPGTFVSRSMAGWNALKDAVNSPGFSPGSSTALGDGISRAVNLLETSAGNDGVIVLMTNGMQNTGNQIVIRPAVHPTLQSFFRLATPTLPAGFVAITAPCIPMQCIGVGAPATIQTDLLNAVSQQTGGLANQTVNASGLTGNFGDTLVETLKGNTMSLHTRNGGTLTAGTPQVAPATTFNLDSSVRQATVVLGWFGSGNQNALKLQLFAPGAVAPVFKTQINEPLYTIQTVELPTNGGAGPWRAEISRNSGNASVPFYMSIYTFEGRFTERLDFKSVRHGTGDDIVLTATLGFNGQPLTGQSSGLKVQAERPAEALDTILHQVNVSPAVLTNPPPGVSSDSFTSRYERKLFELLKTTGLADAIEPKPDPQLLTLFDDGDPAHGDAKAGDGIYSLRYTQTKLPGRYRFKVTMNVNTPSGVVNRVEQRDTEVNVLKPDSDQSEVFATDLSANKFRVDIVPADRFGNFLGPGYTDQVRVTLVGPGTVSSPVVDERENGTYTVELTGVPDPATTRIQVGYLDQTFADITVKDALKPNKRWAVFGGLGANIPHGFFNNFFDSGVSTQLGFEFRFTNRVSAEGTFGYDRFKSTIFGSHQDLFRASGNVKFYPVIGTYQLGIFGGGGVYSFNNGGPTRGGINIGVVNEFRINTSWSVEGTYNFHNVFVPVTQFRFSTVQGGVRYRF